MGHFTGRVAAIITRRPALWAAALLILGITLHRILPVNPWLWLSLGFASVIGAVATVRRPLVCSALIAVATILAGCASAQIAYWYFPPDNIGNFAGPAGQLAWVEGRVKESPRWVESQSRGRPTPDKQMFDVDVRSVL